MTQQFERIQRIELNDLLPNPYQPEGRLEVKPEKAREFALSFQKSGIIQMPIVRHSREFDGKFEVADGWQRRAGAEYAIRELGILEYQEITCVVKNLTDQEMADMIIETTDIRRDMNVIERAQYYRKYFEKFQSVTQVAFAERHNRSQSEIANTLRLLELPEDIQQLIISQEINETHGRALLQLNDRWKIIEMATRVISERLTVKELDEAIKTYLEKVSPKMEITEAPKNETQAPNVESTEAPGEAGREEVAGGLEPVEIDERIPVGGLTEAAAQAGAEVKVVDLVAPVVKTEPGRLPYHNITESQTQARLRQGSDGQAPKTETQAPKVQTTQAPKTSEPVKEAGTVEPIKPKWGRKLVIEEKEGYCLASCMKSGGMPAAKRFDGEFRHAVAVALQWVEALEEQWAKEEGK